MNGHHFQHFVVVERRQNAGETACEHGFARARWAHHQQIVCSGGGNLQRAHGHLLTDHIAEVRHVVACHGDFARSGGGTHGSIAQGRNHIAEGARRGRACVRYAQRFGKIIGRHDQQRTTGRGHMSRHSKHPAHGAQLSIQTQFANRAHALQCVRRQLPTGGQQGEGDGKIEARTCFLHVGRLKVYCDPSRRNRKPRVGQSRSDAVSTLLHRRRGQSDQRPLW